MGKYIRATIKYSAVVKVDDTVGVLRLAEALPDLKKRLVQNMKREVIEKTTKLKTDSLEYEEIEIPDEPKS